MRDRSPLASLLPKLLRDIAGLAAVAAISYGAWLAWPPAGYMVGGALVLAGALLSARHDVPAPAGSED
jgi:hypothetical protein